MTRNRKVVVGIFTLMCILVVIGLIKDRFIPSTTIVNNLTSSFKPQGHEPSPFGHKFKPGDIVRQSNTGYEVVVGSGWLRETHGGDMYYLDMEPPKEAIASDGKIDMHVKTCDSEKFASSINANLAGVTGDLGGVRVNNGCLTVIFGGNIKINDGGHKPDDKGYGAVSARALLLEMKSKGKLDALREKVATRSQKGDKLFIVDEAYIMTGGQYEIEFSGDVSGNVKTSLSKFFDGIFKTETKIDYKYDGRKLIISANPTQRDTQMTLSWKLAPFDI